MAQTLRIVNYAVNGSGTGHLTRLVAVNRWLRRYAQALQLRAEIYFLTSSEADSLLFHEGFASFKMPSKTAVSDAGIDKLTYLAMAKQWVWHSLALLRPDLLVVDTFPSGSFGELLSALDLCRHKAFIHRPVKEEFASRPDFQAMLPLYDLIVVPEHGVGHGAAPGARKPQTERGLRHVGPVMVRERGELWHRDEVRAHFGVPDGSLLVYVSAGGGGDPGAEAQLHAVCSVLLAEPGLHLLVGAGPLYRGRPLFGPRIGWLTQAGAAELLGGCDLAVCAAGYNSYNELMLAGVPTIFLPQEKVADEQDRRAETAEQAGAAICLRAPLPSAPREGAPPGGADTPFARELRAALGRFRDPGTRDQARQAAMRLAPRSHARDAAAALLGLLVPGHQVDAAVAAVSDELLATLRESGTPFEQATELLHALVPHSASGPHREALAQAAGAVQELVQFARAQQIPFTSLVRLVRLCAHKLGTGEVQERVAALRQVLSALLPFSDWPGALTFVKLLVSERQLSPALAAAQIEGFLSARRAQGEDLYRIVARLSAAHGGDAQFTSNRDLLAAARGA